jgi:Heavy metal binding domain
MAGTGHSTRTGMDHSSMPGMAGMDHSAMAGMNHTQTQPAAGTPPVVPGAPKTSAEIARTQPAATLQPDAFDAPAATSVSESQKAAGGAGGHAGHAGHGGAAPAAAPADPHAGHEQGSSAQALYVCPMHPEVTSATPGTCPKCGMTLVKKEP